VAAHEPLPKRSRRARARSVRGLPRPPRAARTAAGGAPARAAGGRDDDHARPRLGAAGDLPAPGSGRGGRGVPVHVLDDRRPERSQDVGRRRQPVRARLRRDRPHGTGLLMATVAATRFGAPLPDGGTIGVCAPSGPYYNASDVLRPREWWESKGYRVKLLDGVWAKDDYEAG